MWPSQGRRVHLVYECSSFLDHLGMDCRTFVRSDCPSNMFLHPHTWKNLLIVWIGSLFFFATSLSFVYGFRSMNDEFEGPPVLFMMEANLFHSNDWTFKWICSTLWSNLVKVDQTFSILGFSKKLIEIFIFKL